MIGFGNNTKIGSAKYLPYLYDRIKSIVLSFTNNSLLTASRETVQVSSDSTGVTQDFSNTSNIFNVFYGGISQTSNWTISVDSETNCITSQVDNTITITALTAEEASYVVRADRADYSSITKTIQVSRVKDGAQGIQGDQGDAATLDVGTTSTLSPGASATVVNSGSTSEAIFDFGIPQGEKGDPGTGSGGTVQDANLSIQATDEGAVTGNARGINAVDLQTVRTAATEVASGDYSTISGGYANTAGGDYSIAAGGINNTTTQLTSSVIGGNTNTASSQGASVIGGTNNTASGQYSAVLGGNGNNAGDIDSCIIGGNSNVVTGTLGCVIGGQNNEAMSYGLVLGGNNNTSRGVYSIAAGIDNYAFTYGETIFGVYAESAAGSQGSIVGAEPILRVGAGTSTTPFDAFRVDKDGDIHVPKSINIDEGGTFGTTTGLWFGDGDTGFYESADDTLAFSTSNVARYVISGNSFRANRSLGAQLSNVSPTSTTPVLNFYQDENTGVGRAGADQLSLIAGGTEGIRVETAGTFAYNLKSGTSQVNAGAAANELWIDTADNSIKIGV